MNKCEMCGKSTDVKKYNVKNVYTEAAVTMELCDHCWDTHTCACGTTISDSDYLGDDECPYCEEVEG